MLYDVLFAASYIMALLLSFAGGVIAGQGLAMSQARKALDTVAGILNKLTKGKTP